MGMIDFNTSKLGYMGMEVPQHTQETLLHYFLYGMKPGGFAEAMLAHDLERALYNADTANRQMFWAIAVWIRESAPAGSHGSYDAVKEWCKSDNPTRSAFLEKYEKEKVWKILNET